MLLHYLPGKGSCFPSSAFSGELVRPRTDKQMNSFTLIALNLKCNGNRVLCISMRIYVSGKVLLTNRAADRETQTLSKINNRPLKVRGWKQLLVLKSTEPL